MQAGLGGQATLAVGCEHLCREGAPTPEAVACAAGHIRRPPAPRARSGAIFSVVAHAICACHFLLTIRCQSKGPGACYAPPSHSTQITWGLVRHSLLKAPCYGWLSHLKQMITETLFTRLIKSFQPRLTTGWSLHMASTNNLSQWLLAEAPLHKEPPSTGGPTTPAHGCSSADAAAKGSLWVTTEMQLRNAGIACGMGKTLQQEQLLGLCLIYGGCRGSCSQHSLIIPSSLRSHF